MVSNTNKYGQNAKASAKAQLDAGLTEETTALKKTYNDAVAQGDISVRDAQIAYDKQVGNLNKQYYGEMKNANLYGNQMGMQNSNQMLGLQSSINERQIQNTQNSAIVRDQSIADIKTKLNALKTSTDLDIAKAQSVYNSNLARSNSEIDMNVLNQLNSLGQWKGNQLFQTQERLASQGFQASEAQKTRDAANQYHTSNDILSAVKIDGFQETKKGWTKDGKTFYKTPEQAYANTTAYLNAINKPTDAEVIKANKLFETLKGKVNDSVIKTQGDFGFVDPLSYQNDGKYNKEMPFYKEALWSLGNIGNTGKYGKTGYNYEKMTNDVKSYNAQVKAYTQVWLGLPKNLQSQYAEPPKLRKIVNGNVIEEDNKWLK
jgi:hypothetical protein